MAIAETLVLSTVVPAVIDLVKGAGGAISRKWFGLSVDDQVKVQNLDIERMKAVAALDTPVGTPSQWVVDLRASFRYIAAPLIIIIGAFITKEGIDLKDQIVIDVGAQLICMPFGFIFGERLLLGLKSLGKK